MPEVAEAASPRREAIVEAAVRVFSAHGFDAGTIRAIAVEAGVSEGLIYRYFDSKGALLEAVIRERSVLGWLNRRDALPDDLPVDAALGALVREGLARLETNIGPVAVLWSQLATNGQMARIVGGLVRDVTDRISAYLDRKVARGELRPVDTVVAARALAAAMVGFAIQQHRMCPPLVRLSSERYTQGLVDLLVGGLLPPAEGRRREGKGAMDDE